MMVGSSAALEMRHLPPLLRSGRPSLARGKRALRLPLAPRSQQGPQEGASGATLTEAAPRAPAAATVLSRKQEGASTDLSVILPRLKKVGLSWSGGNGWLAGLKPGSAMCGHRPAMPGMRCAPMRTCLAAVMPPASHPTIGAAAE